MGANAGWQVQKKAKCIVGKDYPNRIVDHDVIHKVNISRMSEAYKANKEPTESKPSPKAQPAAKKQKTLKF
jgi:cryptochrome